MPPEKVCVCVCVCVHKQHSVVFRISGSVLAIHLFSVWLKLYIGICDDGEVPMCCEATESNR